MKSGRNCHVREAEKFLVIDGEVPLPLRRLPVQICKLL